MEKLQNANINENNNDFNIFNSEINSASFCIKIIYKNQTKRINEVPKTLHHLKELINNIFNLKKFDLSQIIVYAIPSENQRENDNNYINQEKDYLNVLNSHCKNNQNSLKLYLEIGKSKSHDENKFNNVDIKIKEIIDSKFSLLEENMNSLIQNYSNSYVSNSYLQPDFLKNENYAQNTIYINQKKKENKFFIQCDLCLVYPIVNIKFICLICDDLNLCENCEPLHNHPVVKFKSPEFSTKNDICNLIMSNNSSFKNSFKEMFVSKQDFLSKIKEKIIKGITYKVEFEMTFDYYIIKPNSKFQISLNVKNVGGYDLPEDCILYVKNFKDISFSNKKLGKILSPKTSIHINIECQTTLNLGEYDLQIHIYQKDLTVEYEPFKFKIKVSENIYEDVNDHDQLKRSQASFSPEDTVSTLPAYKKDILSEIIRNDLSNKDILEICSILEKHNWKLTENAKKEISDSNN